jgi:metal-responsive CopG/Arc/MetJ family transcriptional regulator
MTQSITVTLPLELKAAIDDVSRREGITADEVVSQAIQQHLFLRQFRRLRERMSAKAASQGVVTDQDVFDRVS